MVLAELPTLSYNRKSGIFIGELGTGRVGSSAVLCGGSPAVALGIDLEDGRVMDEAVDGGDGHGRIGEDLVPLAEGLIAGDDEALALVALGDEVEEDGGLGLILTHIIEVVEDEAVELVELGEGGRHGRQPLSSLPVEAGCAHRRGNCRCGNRTKRTQLSTPAIRASLD